MKPTLFHSRRPKSRKKLTPTDKAYMLHFVENKKKEKEIERGKLWER